MNGGAIVPTNTAPPSAAATSLAPGFRFHPTDEELVIYYLKRKICGRVLRIEAIAEVDLYKCEPWDLPGLSRIRSRDREWYFFSPLDRKYSNRSRTNRATGQGYWKTTGKDRQVRHGQRVVGMKKTLVFHIGRAPHGERTNWVMHEYRLEDAQLSEIPQDAYVVCRIFQKNGAGPQNGAQYGATFVEEEWEDEANGLVILPDGGEDEFNDAGEQAFVEFKDFLSEQNFSNDESIESANKRNFSQDLGNHDGSSLFAVSPDGQDGSTFPEDTNNVLEEMLKDSSFIADVVDGIDEPVQLNIPSPTDEVGRGNTGVKDSHICPGQNDEYVELIDLADNENGDCLSIEDSVSHPSSSDLRNIHDVDEFFDSISEYPDQSELVPVYTLQDSLYQQTNGIMNSYTGLIHSGQQDEGNIPFNNVPRSTQDNFTQMDELFGSSVTGQHDFEMVDDLMAYFDATEGYLLNDTVGFSEGSVCLNSSILGHPNFSKEVQVNGDKWEASDATRHLLDANVGVGGSSSAASAANHRFKEKSTDFTVAPGTSASLNEGGDKTITKRLVNMLGSISAPPAIAAEFPPVSGKSVAQVSADHLASSIHVTAGVIRIRGSTVSRNEAQLSLQKNGDLGFLVSYSMADNVVPKSVGCEPITKIQGAAVAVVLRGGFYLFFLSALILAMSYKVGMCIYGR